MTGFPRMTSGRPALLRRNQGVRIRSTIVGTLLVTIALLIGAAVMLFMLNRADSRTMYDETSYRAYEIAAEIREGGISAISPESVSMGSGADIVQVIDGNGRVVASSPGAAGDPVTSARPAPWTSTQVKGRLIPGSESEFCATATATAYDGAAYTVVVAVSADAYRQSLINTALVLAVELPILVLLSAVAIWFFVGRALRPVGRITEQVTAITASDLSRRVPVPSTDDEVTRLATTMNSMLERLEQSRAAQLRFVGDASHEMRSPLTTVVGLLDLADDTDSPIDVTTLRTLLLPEARRLQNMVDDLLLLARSDEHGVPLHIQDVDLDDIVVSEARRLRSLGLATVATTIIPIRASGDPEKLSRAIRNLAENAVRYAASTVRFDMYFDPATGFASIAVTDDGPGVPPEGRDIIFDRFTRLDVDRRNRSGSGLGLSIVREIVRAHGGSVSVQDPPAGFAHGVTFVISLPTARRLPDGAGDGEVSTALAMPHRQPMR